MIQIIEEQFGLVLTRFSESAAIEKTRETPGRTGAASGRQLESSFFDFRVPIIRSIAP